MKRDLNKMEPGYHRGDFTLRHLKQEDRIWGKGKKAHCYEAREMWEMRMEIRGWSEVSM